MTSKGIVIKTDTKTATVKVRRNSACGHDCGECRLCDGGEIKTVVKNTVGAKEGDVVTIGTDSSKVLLCSFILYVVPILGAAVCYALASRIFSKPFFLALIIVLWFVLWFVCLRRFSAENVITSSILEVSDEKN